MKLYILSGDYKYHNGERKFRAVTYDKTWITFNGKTKISTGINRKEAGKVHKLKFSGETKCLGMSSFYLMNSSLFLKEFV